MWGARVDDGLVSWYVSYRGCTALDWRAVKGWCGMVQVSKRTDGSALALHVAALTLQGASVSFGKRSFATVTLPAAVPASVDPSSGTVGVTLRVNRA